MSTVKERPILMSCEMVRAILDDRKSQTRRVVKSQHAWSPEMLKPEYVAKVSPYGAPADRLWVRETWKPHLCSNSENERIHYRADGESCPHDGETLRHWKPSIFMPRWASRIALEITEVRVERLQEISEADARCEGPPKEVRDGFARAEYVKIWDSINGRKHPWSSNCWVWVLSFKQV